MSKNTVVLSVAAIVLVSGLQFSGEVLAADLAGIIHESRSTALDQRPLLSMEPLRQEVGGSVLMPDDQYGAIGGEILKPLALSLLMPGLGEVSMGYKRGYVLMALDIFSWLQVRSANQNGNDLKAEYLDFADLHWSEDVLRASFDVTADFHPGFDYYQVDAADSLSLWVSREDDEREYYENLGKWDQFVFGWDDFIDPRAFPDYDAGATTTALRDPRVSLHREDYREMRISANDEFDKRDLLVKLNMASRLVSMLQVAWLSGAFNNGEPEPMEIGGHQLSMIAETRGLTSGRFGISLSY